MKKHDGWAADETIAENYAEICIEASKEKNVFEQFKRDKRYTPILEHVSKKQGKQYLKKIIKNDKKYFLENMNLFRENDKYGGPIKYKYGKYGWFSPTTLRYVSNYFQLRKLFGDLNGFDVFEIGGGYGGLCKTISAVASFGSYSIVDIEPALMLTKKYLGKFSIENVKFYKQEELLQVSNIDLLISNYALSECNKSVQDFYIEKLISNSKRGYVTYNKFEKTETGAYSSDEFKEILTAKFQIQSFFEGIKGTDCEIIIWGSENKFFFKNRKFYL